MWCEREHCTTRKHSALNWVICVAAAEWKARKHKIANPAWHYAQSDTNTTRHTLTRLTHALTRIVRMYRAGAHTFAIALCSANAVAVAASQTSRPKARTHARKCTLHIYIFNEFIFLRYLLNGTTMTTTMRTHAQARI